ncbi:unnamed protein product [Diabrotica balteata]|uniref:Uncharacterized protein n=1 Tax=Diabrotica balteata TaxID=107213 RepID=A0A9N9T0X4_DIABA|nr:unnamed protein product [Diabrotica balteata]
MKMVCSTIFAALIVIIMTNQADSYLNCTKENEEQICEHCCGEPTCENKAPKCSGCTLECNAYCGCKIGYFRDTTSGECVNDC